MQPLRLSHRETRPFRSALILALVVLPALFITCQTESDLGTGPTSVQPPDRPAAVFDSLTRALANQVSADTLLATVRVLSGEVSFQDNDSSFTVRSRYSTDTSHALAIRYILQRLRSFGLTPQEQSFGTGGKNIIATQGGSVDPDRFVIIGAHYDSMPKDSISPGADDNASGVAATLEAARVFSKVQPARSVVYAFWDREEQGLLGSKAYADQARAAGKLIDGVVNVDMIGYDGDSDLKVEVHVNGTALSNVVADSMARANVICATPLNLVVINPGTTASDHASFWQKSYGALLLIEEYSGHDFNPFYHSRNDRVAAMSQAYFTYAARLAAGTVARLAGPLSVPAGLPRR